MPEILGEIEGSDKALLPGIGDAVRLRGAEGSPTKRTAWFGEVDRLLGVSCCDESLDVAVTVVEPRTAAGPVEDTSKTAERSVGRCDVVPFAPDQLALLVFWQLQFGHEDELQ